MPDTQLGEPAKAAAAIITVAFTGDAPLHELLGSDSLAIAEGTLRALRSEVDRGRALAVTTDIPTV